MGIKDIFFNSMKLIVLLCFISSLVFSCSSGGDSNKAPIAEIISPADNGVYYQGDAIFFNGAGTDQEDGTLPNSGLSWTSSLSGPIGNGQYFTLTNLAVGQHVITLMAKDSKNSTGTDSITITIKAVTPTQNNPPKATISSPQAGQSFVEGASITFTGSAADDEDGDLTGNSLEWSSNVKGVIGQGKSISVNTLSVGTHTITLKATDSDGATGTASISISVTSSTPGNSKPTVTITSPTQTSFNPGDDVVFTGTASDKEDGQLGESSLYWIFGSNSTPVAYGSTYTIAAIQVGTYTINLIATDSQGAIGTASITITVASSSQVLQYPTNLPSGWKDKSQGDIYFVDNDTTNMMKYEGLFISVVPLSDSVKNLDLSDPALLDEIFTTAEAEMAKIPEAKGIAFKSKDNTPTTLQISGKTIQSYYRPVSFNNFVDIGIVAVSKAKDKAVIFGLIKVGYTGMTDNHKMILAGVVCNACQ
ncbi:MAG: hypothetical protein HQK76_03795 [Desulfobacterales bacterium]|nr:hypothetical protein [Desulfobacterales bacterium]